MAAQPHYDHPELLNEAVTQPTLPLDAETQAEATIHPFVSPQAETVEKKPWHKKPAVWAIGLLAAVGSGIGVKAATGGEDSSIKSATDNSSVENTPTTQVSRFNKIGFPRTELEIHKAMKESGQYEFKPIIPDGSSPEKWVETYERQLNAFYNSGEVEHFDFMYINGTEHEDAAEHLKRFKIVEDSQVNYKVTVKIVEDPNHPTAWGPGDSSEDLLLDVTEELVSHLDNKPVYTNRFLEGLTLDFKEIPVDHGDGATLISTPLIKSRVAYGNIN